jgi:hypothetical protein
MTVEILVDEKGKILALNTAHEGQQSARRTAREPRGEKSRALWPPTIGMQPRAGQQRYLVTLPAELEAMPLKEIHSLFRLVHDVGGPRLERIASRAGARPRRRKS